MKRAIVIVTAAVAAARILLDALYYLEDRKARIAKEER